MRTKAPGFGSRPCWFFDEDEVPVNILGKTRQFVVAAVPVGALFRVPSKPTQHDLLRQPRAAPALVLAPCRFLPAGARFQAVSFSYGPEAFGALSPGQPADPGGGSTSPQLLPAVPQLKPEFAPHLRFTPQPTRREMESFQQLHRHCLTTSQALACATSISTPNLEWGVGGRGAGAAHT